MGFRRRTRRRALVAGAAVATIRNRNQQQAARAGRCRRPAAGASRAARAAAGAAAPPPPDPADQIEHHAQLHASGALTDEEFAAVKAKILGSLIGLGSSGGVGQDHHERNRGCYEWFAQGRAVKALEAEVGGNRSIRARCSPTMSSGGRRTRPCRG